MLEGKSGQEKDDPITSDSTSLTFENFLVKCVVTGDVSGDFEEVHMKDPIRSFLIVSGKGHSLGVLLLEQ